MYPLDPQRLKALLVEGRWYRIRHRSETQRRDRESVLQFLGWDDRLAAHGRTPELVLNARPVAGTQQMPASWVLAVEEVPRPERPVLSRVL